MSAEFYVQGPSDLPPVLAEIERVRSDGGAKVTVSAVDERTARQNRMLHATIGDISKQVVWYGKKLTVQEWKYVFTAAIEKQEVVPGIDGGFVVLGRSTSRMPKKMFASLITVALAFGDERGVKWCNENWRSMVETYLSENGYLKS